ncbi:large extracellular alpha-helical protein [Hoeflea sp. IMCC20628]|uniref:alpha-2-macroglobulin family protein n=1 Tax=Hoeflea sp. IMCC20628 TaxID=1620421 RepID=UPI00063AF156|nr:alpha-2-macroglobulin family protein [Hoeflea sp. IMCC20628]AKI00756.1 large extracellular alpha-helical protein [Hoeflea sp. IMCC20628]
MSAIHRILLLVCAIGLSAPVMAQEGSRRIETTQDADYFGYDLRTVQGIALEECETICLGDRQCKAFTYNVKAGWCFLKSDYDTLNSFTGAVAGRVVTGAAETDLGAAPDLAFVPASLLDAARTYRDRIVARDSSSGQRATMLLRLAEASIAAGDREGAVRNFAIAVAADPEQSSTWAELSRAASAYAPQDSKLTQSLRSVAVSAAINAYKTSRTVSARANSLAALGEAFEGVGNWRPAISAYRASLELREVPALRSTYAELRANYGFRVVDNSVDADSETPRVCVQFSENLVKGQDYSRFVSIDGASGVAIETDDRQICVNGLEHGQRYRLVLRQGLPSAVDETLEAPVELSLYVRDRSPAARFTGSNFVLPAKSRLGIPLVTINAPSAELKLFRVGDRALSRIISGSDFLNQLDSYAIENILQDVGSAVWEGAIDIASVSNREVITSIPVETVLPEREPGVYVLTAVPLGDKSEHWDSRATQWFVISDIGVTTFAGDDGLSVFLRSLDSAEPLGSVKLTLLARNNEVLGEAVTDADGRATFQPGLIRGQSGLAPAALLAKGPEGDFVFLDLTRSGFDLSDRGVAGRASPGGVDVMAWTERGIYRAGETVHLAALARDSKTEALANLPLTVIVQRPDGVEDRRVVSDGATLGGHALAIDLPENAMQGAWRAALHTDPKRPAIAEVSFLVEDFQPDRIEIELDAGDAVVSPDAPAQIAVKGRYLYGAPAGGLSTEGEIVLSRTRSLASYQGYEFGLADEEFENSRIQLDTLSPLDPSGESVVDIDLGQLPVTTQFLKADVTIRASEGGGRAVERTVELKVAADGPRIGINPQFDDGQVAESSEAAFQVIAIDAQGSRIAMPGSTWSLVRIERNYQWYRQGNSWNYEVVDFTTEIADGDIDIAAESAASIAANVDWGRYRLDVASADGAEASVLFDAGWHVEAKSTETPDGLEIALDKDRYSVGETAQLRISPRFAGQALITVGSERLITTVTAAVGEDGATIALPVTDDWGAGAYVTATLYRPGDEESRLPMRAIGVKWLSVDPGDRQLSVTLDLPEQTKPRTEFTVPVTLAGLPAGEAAFVTVSAVDVGILNLTRHTVANPEDWYFGQRALGLEIRDIYGRLIDGSAGVTGRVRSGGDGPMMRSEGSPSREKLVAFFEGPVQVDADGNASVTFDMPQFNGTVRVNVVAWSSRGVGHATKDVIVRDPVVITASLPQFLAPGDRSQILVELANTDGPAGTYGLELFTASGRVSSGDGMRQDFTLRSGARSSLVMPLEGLASGSDTITIALTGPDGLALDREEIVMVRPAAMPVTTKRIISLAGNGGTLRIDGELLADSLLDGASVTVGVTRNAAFDVASLLMALDRYPYGCAEQTTSRALPLLYLSDLGESGGGDDADAIRERIEGAITRLVAYQSASGSFGLWGPGSGDLWLDAYVTDFLTRAAEKGFSVPPVASRLALDNLQNTLSYTTDVGSDGSSIAYALYVLARNRKAAVTDLRYYSDSQIDEFAQPLARAQIGAALSLYGDPQRAEESFRSAFTHAQSTARLVGGRNDYGSALRDGAAMLALAAESTPTPGVVPELIRFVSDAKSARTSTSTQEDAWMVLAARAITEGNRSISVNVNGRVYAGAYDVRMSGEEIGANPVTIVNQGPDPVDAVVTTIAAPAQPLSAGGNGFSINRSYYTLDGQPASISSVNQNERFLVVLQMREINAWPSRVIVTDLLPAGFAIDNPRLVGSAELGNFPWLGETSASHAEFRTDRFMAAFDRTGSSNRDFVAAYVVRATTPGIYAQPAAVVEDMYRPELAARTATGVLEVLGQP